ncbi:MAG: hypothetical protein DVB31_15350 [Verrucomicrobia bacterium]|nr:MAG: hypothetical protein DVB31_15350 [Verrucomicrobiota bacterium]
MKAIASRDTFRPVAVAAFLAAGLVMAGGRAEAGASLSAIATASAYTEDPFGPDFVFAPEINNRAVDVVPAKADSKVVFPVQQTGATYPRSGENIVVFASTGATAGLGDLHVYVNSDGHSDATHRQYYAMGHADATARFTDTFVVQPSAAHPAGNFVPLKASLQVDQLLGGGPGAEVSSLALLSFEGPDITDPFNPRGNPLGVNGTLYRNIHYLDGVKDNDRTLDQADAQFLVGATYTLSGSLSAFVTTQTGNTSTVWLRDSMGGVNALDTAHCHVWSEDPAVTIKAGSGATYTPPAPAAPSLAIRHDGGDIVVSWPASASGFRLFSSPSLSPAEWTEVTAVPGVDGDRLTVPLRPDDAHRFFRLQ